MILLGFTNSCFSLPVSFLLIFSSLGLNRYNANKYPHSNRTWALCISDIDTPTLHVKSNTAAQCVRAYLLSVELEIYYYRWFVLSSAWRRDPIETYLFVNKNINENKPFYDKLTLRLDIFLFFFFLLDFDRSGAILFGKYSVILNFFKYLSVMFLVNIFNERLCACKHILVYWWVYLEEKKLHLYWANGQTPKVHAYASGCLIIKRSLFVDTMLIWKKI